MRLGKPVKYTLTERLDDAIMRARHLITTRPVEYPSMDVEIILAFLLDLHTQMVVSHCSSCEMLEVL